MKTKMPMQLIRFFQDKNLMYDQVRQIIIYVFICFSLQKTLSEKRISNMVKATITRCDLSPRFFCIDATFLCEFESDKI